jgi:hypothetical protein
MGKVNVIIVDATGNKEQKVGLPDDVKIGIIMVKLVEKIKLPSTGPDGNPISYKFIHKVSGRQLLETQTLADAHIKDGDVLRLQPEITAGAICNKCGIELQDGQAFCPECGCPVGESGIDTSAFTPVRNLNYEKTNTIEKIKETSGKFSDVGSIIASVIGIISGIVSMVLGFIVMGYSDGYFESAASYGGDAYTGIQNAAAQTANNVEDLAAIVKFGTSSLLIIVGVAIACFFALKLFDYTKKGE